MDTADGDRPAKLSSAAAASSAGQPPYRKVQRTTGSGSASTSVVGGRQAALKPVNRQPGGQTGVGGQKQPRGSVVGVKAAMQLKFGAAVNC